MLLRAVPLPLFPIVMPAAAALVLLAWTVVSWWPEGDRAEKLVNGTACERPGSLTVYGH